MTLPLIRALQVGDHDDAALIRHAVEGGGRLTDFAPILAALERTGALAYARDRAVAEARAAAASLSGMPPTPHLRSLLQLSSFAADRSF